MKNITFTADEALIERARNRARRENTTLNEEFRRWLERYARPQRTLAEREAILRDLAMHGSTGGQKFTRDEMNER